jgi:hypothetical protein
MLFNMATAKARTLAELLAQKQAVKEQAAAEIAAVRKNLAERTAALKASERRLRAVDIREKKKRDNHAKIVIGVAMIWKCQSSPPSAEKFKELLAEFYADSPERLNAALYGLTIAVKKPESDAEQD